MIVCSQGWEVDGSQGVAPSVGRREPLEQFFTTKDVGKGTGLGLSVAHGVIAQSGGDIVVHSEPGAGSRFLIYLPRSGEVAAAARPATLQLTGGDETVLVVDDDADVLAVIQRTLRHAGYPVLVAGSGDQALEILRQHEGRVDLVLTDVAMPGVGGRELADRVRADYPNVRVLFSSGYAESIIARHGVRAEGVQFIAKPYSLQALTRKVRDVLDA